MKRLLFVLTFGFVAFAGPQVGPVRAASGETGRVSPSKAQLMPKCAGR